VKDYRFSQRSSRWTSLGMWRCVDGSRRTMNHSASIFKDQGVKGEVQLFCPHPCSERYKNTAILRHIPEDFNPKMNQSTSFHPLPYGPFQYCHPTGFSNKMSFSRSYTEFNSPGALFPICIWRLCTYYTALDVEIMINIIIAQITLGQWGTSCHRIKIL